MLLHFNNLFTYYYTFKLYLIERKYNISYLKTTLTIQYNTIVKDFCASKTILPVILHLLFLTYLYL